MELIEIGIELREHKVKLRPQSDLITLLRILRILESKVGLGIAYSRT